MSETPNAPPPARPRRRLILRGALILSLALNLLLIGVMAGGMMRFAHLPPPPETQIDFRSLWRALPTDARNELRDMARERGMPDGRGAWPTPQERHARMLQTNGRIIALLQADPFDAEAFAEVLSGERQQLNRRLDTARRAFAERLADLDPAERQAMAAQLEQDWARRLPQH